MIRAMQSAWKRLAAMTRVPPPTSYKIIHDPQLGYAAAYCLRPLDWWVAIDGFGEEAQSIDCIAKPLWRDLWVATEEEAGKRINLHATSRGRTEVWAA